MDPYTQWYNVKCGAYYRDTGRVMPDCDQDCKGFEEAEGVAAGMLMDGATLVVISAITDLLETEVTAS